MCFFVCSCMLIQWPQRLEEDVGPRISGNFVLLMWMLGTKLGSSTGPLCTLNH